MSEAMGDYTRSQRLQAASELQDIRMASSSAELIDFGSGGSLAGNVSVEVGAGPTPSGDAFVVGATYSIDLWPQDFADDFLQRADEDGEAPDLPEEKRVANVRVKYMALYTIPGSETFDEEEYVAFGTSAGLLHLHPYAREYVQDATGRLGLQPFVMDPLKIQNDRVIPTS